MNNGKQGKPNSFKRKQRKEWAPLKGDFLNMIFIVFLKRQQSLFLLKNRLFSA